MNFMVTGATGYIGKRVLLHATRKGHQIFAASRKSPKLNYKHWLPFELNSKVSIIIPSNINAVIHLAAKTTSNIIDSDDIEYFAAQKIITAAKKVSAKFIYVSSQTAREDAPTSYGLIKWKIEQEVLKSGGWVVRLGQVYGGSAEGSFGMLLDFVKNLPVLPIFLPAPKVQPIHVDDVAEGLIRITESNDIPSSVLSLASPKPVSFHKFLAIIASQRIRKKRWFLPFPILLIKFIGSILGLHLRVYFGIERLRSLFDLNFMDTGGNLKQIKLSLRPLSNGMHPSGNDNRRKILREGNALFSYILKQKPNLDLLRRYLHSVEQIRGGCPLKLPEVFFKLPVLFSLLDKQAHLLNHQCQEFLWRLQAVLVLAEATPEGAKLFLNIENKSGIFINLYSIFKSLLAEIFWRIARIIFYPVIRFLFNKER